MDIVAVSPTEVIRSRASRKIAEHWNAELALALEVGPWDIKRGVNTEVKRLKPLKYEDEEEQFKSMQKTIPLKMRTRKS